MRTPPRDADGGEVRRTPLKRKAPLRAKRLARVTPRPYRKPTGKLQAGLEVAHVGAATAKPVRETDEVYRAYIRTLPCVAHGCPPPSDPHHVRTRGAGGHDRGNLIPLCRFAHDEVDSLGDTLWAAKYGFRMIDKAVEIDARYEASHARA